MYKLHLSLSLFLFLNVTNLDFNARVKAELEDLRFRLTQIFKESEEAKNILFQNQACIEARAKEFGDFCSDVELKVTAAENIVNQALLK